MCFCNTELISLKELKKDDYLLKMDSHHIPYYFHINNNKKYFDENYINLNKRIYFFKSCNFDEFKMYLDRCNWSFIDNLVNNIKLDVSGSNNDGNCDIS